MSQPQGAPISEFFIIRKTPHSGRAVFATQDIPADTLIAKSDDLSLGVILREYRKEVCAWCFTYDLGSTLPIRDLPVGFVYCSAECQAKWRENAGGIGIEAWTTVEKLTKNRSKEDSEMQDISLPRPTTKEIKAAWEGAGEQAAMIRIARKGAMVNGHATSKGVNGNGINGIATEDGGKPTKRHRKALQKALLAPISPDSMAFCLAGILFRYSRPEDWPSIEQLAADSRPYHNADDLHGFTRTYLQLLAILPEPLLDITTKETLFVLSSRDSHNSFGIRSLEDEGSEFFGYGCWPSASYFNHSCGQNVEKQREGRRWEFRAGRDIEEGEELCITYLSGEERRMSRGARQLRLKSFWGFDCQCERCEEL